MITLLNLTVGLCFIEIKMPVFNINEYQKYKKHKMEFRNEVM